MEEIKLVEVGPRDGFQNVCDFIPTEIKLNIIDKIAQAGVRNIMITSFVSPRAIPQMRDAREVAGICLSDIPASISAHWSLTSGEHRCPGRRYP